MSVVNDILKDLHERRGQHQYITNIPFDFEDNSDSKRNVLTKFFFIAIILIVLSVIVYLAVLNTQSKQELSFDDSDTSMGVEVNERSPVTFDHNHIYDSAIENIETEKSITVNEDIDIQALPVRNTIQSLSAPAFDKTKHSNLEQEHNKTQFVEPKKIIASSTNVSDQNIVVKDVPNTQRSSIIKAVNNDELLVRKLMLSNPEKVWPHIKKILPQSSNKISLIALGAQGEQRSKNHQNAIGLYKTLSEIEPGESKWRVGAAISFDALSKYDEALIEYKKSLKLNSLPSPLHSFVNQRIAQLTGADDER